ncbi:MAG TPA: hypothetical protein VK933_03625 [Longimicrobiales bacterium]|nr:hypothetical protein [Longimicrobiales bacterium]
MPHDHLSTLWARLRNDLVFRVATLYAGGSWFLIEALDTLQMSVGLVRGMALALAVVFLPVVAAAYFWQRRAPRLDAATAAGDSLAGDGRRSWRRGTRRWAVALVSLCVVALGLWAFGARWPAGDVPPAAERIAVLPFHATGAPDVQEFAVGMVDLLSAALGDVGPIRTVASRTVLARVRDSEGEWSLDDALTTGRDLGAGAVLTGSITAFGRDVRVIAEIHEVVSGEVIARAEVQGAQQDMLPLTDRLAVSLVQDLWRSRNPMPTVRVASLTTEVPTALRAWLRGEEHLRATRFDSAVHYFGRAVTEDSTFALAWARLGEAVGWASEAGATVVERREYQERALAVSDRLPERERSLLRALDLRLRGSFEGFDSLQAYVDRYPDDPMGWYQLGDARYHAQYLGRFDVDQISEAFLESTRLDPAFGIGLAHVLDLSLMRDDRAVFDSVLPLYARFGDPARTDSYHRRARVRWAAPDSLLPLFAAEQRTLHPRDDRTMILQLIGMVGLRARVDLRLDPLVYVHALDSVAAIHADSRDLQEIFQRRRVDAWGAMGSAGNMLAEIDRTLEVATDGPLPRPVLRSVVRTAQALEVDLPMALVSDDAANLVSRLDEFPDVAGVLQGYWLRTGEVDKAREVPLDLGDLRDLDREAARDAVSAWFRMEAGDTVGALPVLDAAIERLGYEDTNYLGLPWHHYGRVLTRFDGRRAQGIRILEQRISVLSGGTGLMYLALGRAWEAEGERSRARRAYEHAYRFFRHSDEHMRDRLEEVEAALARLSVESPS